MSYVNLPPEATFAKLDSIIKRQRRLMMVDAAATALFASTLIASLISLF